ncbi:hypothetical protein Tsubulata_004553 [Turnera subulata]|uniref:CCHC-type domain-containing protein n=1 Tax=Turnera subulata TaxID=218843 RepID=A0A9Q0FTY3_9ROSI|nr:hypothetical protein Tsubulata_004553 [Turnera subulata]
MTVDGADPVASRPAAWHLDLMMPQQAFEVAILGLQVPHFVPNFRHDFGEVGFHGKLKNYVFPCSPCHPCFAPPFGKLPDIPQDSDIVDVGPIVDDAMLDPKGHVSAEQYDKPSFLETLMKNQEWAKEKCLSVDLIKENNVHLDFVDGDQLRPSFGLDDIYYQRLCTSMDLLDLGSGCFLAKFGSLVDLERVVTRGPWLSMAWVRLPRLHLQYYDDDLLATFASVISKPVKTDSNMSEATRALYARMCVEVDLSQPLVPIFCIQEVFKVQYKGLHMICMNCGRYGHTTVQCQFDSPEVPLIPVESVELENAMEVLSDSDPPPLVSQPVQVSQSKSSNFGEWMVVTQKPRSAPWPKQAVDGHYGSGATSSNCFSIFSVEFEPAPKPPHAANGGLYFSWSSSAQTSPSH